jgi:uncharacterized protein YjbI with pentapeptide repeats
MPSESEKRDPLADHDGIHGAETPHVTQTMTREERQPSVTTHESALRRIGTWFKDSAWAKLATLVITVGGTYIGLFIADRSADIEDRKQVSERMDLVYEKLRSADVNDQVFGIRELYRLGVDAPDDLRDTAIDRIAEHVQSVAERTVTVPCRNDKVVDVVQAGLEAIGELNQDGSGSIDLSNTCLRNVSLRSNNFNLSRVNFTSSDLTGARFVDVDLTDTRFDWAVLSKTEFSAVNLTGAVFCWAYTAEADIRSGTFVHTALQEQVKASLSHKSIDISQVADC